MIRILKLFFVFYLQGSHSLLRDEKNCDCEVPFNNVAQHFSFTRELFLEKSKNAEAFP